MTIPWRVFFFKIGIFMFSGSLFDEHDKDSNLLGIVTRSILGEKLIREIPVGLLFERVMNMLDSKM